MMRFFAATRRLYICLCCIVVPGLTGCAILHDPDSVNGTRISLQSDGGSVGVFTADRGRGSPILFIHGLGTNTNTWRKIAPQFAASHRVIMIDLKGFGRSEKPIDHRYSVEDQSALVAKLIQKKRLKNLTIVGHSFGGAVALSTALRLRQQRDHSVRRLVLIDSAAYPQKLPAGLTLLATPGVAHLTMPEVIAKGLLWSSYAKPSRIERRDVYAYARPLYEAGAKHALVTTVQNLAARRNAPSKLYQRLNMPVQLIWCASDPIVPRWVGVRLKRDLPNARLAILNDCSHVPQEEQPEQTAQILHTFLAR